MVSCRKIEMFSLGILLLIVTTHIHASTYISTNESLGFNLESLRLRRSAGGKHKLTSNHSPTKPVTHIVDRIKYAKSNLIHNDLPNENSTVIFCYPERKRQKRQLAPGPGNDEFNDIVNGLRVDSADRKWKKHHLQIGAWDRRNFPFREVIAQADIDNRGEPINVPVYLRAEILSSHINQPRPNIPVDIRNYLDRTGPMVGNIRNDPNSDDAGHLLAHSLGGTSTDQFNFVPQTQRLNRHPTNGGWSMWRGEEQRMVSFLSTRGRRIEWELYIERASSEYRGYYRLRPTLFFLRHRNYNEHGVLVDNLNNPIREPEHVMVFSNDPNDECRYEPL